jgi:hypothetical protein
MHAVIDSLHRFYNSLLNFFHSLLNSPHHLLAYVAAVAVIAVLLVCIPLARALFGSRSRSSGAGSPRIASSSMLGLTALPVDFRPAAPIERAPSPSIERAPNPIPSNVTAINESLTVPCIHCGVTMPSRQDFCPACGYAQPVKESFAAAFPA